MAKKKRSKKSSNKSVWVSGYMRRGERVKSYHRRKPKK